MSKHRVDINLRGMSHYVDDRLEGASGFPLWDRQLPEGLHLERRGGHQPGRERKKFVKKKGFGASVEWTSDRDAHGTQGGRNMPGPPPGQRPGRRPGPQRGPGPEEVGRRNPGLFDIPEGEDDNEEDEGDENDRDDAHSRAPSRREDNGIANYRGHRGYPGHDNPDRTMRREGSVQPRERMHREAARAHDPRGGGESAYSRAPSRRNSFGTGNNHPDTRPPYSSSLPASRPRVRDRLPASLPPVAYPYMRDGNGNIGFHPSTRPPYPSRLPARRPR